MFYVGVLLYLDHLPCRRRARTPLFRETRYLLAEEPDLRDTALYLSVLAAVADGNDPGGMAGYLERKATRPVWDQPVIASTTTSGTLLRADAGHARSCRSHAGGMLCSYWKTLWGSYFALIWRSRSKLGPQ